MASNRARYNMEESKREPAYLPDTADVRKRSDASSNNNHFMIDKITHQPGERISSNQIGTPAIAILFDNPESDGVEKIHTAKTCFCTACRKTFDLEQAVTAKETKSNYEKETILSPHIQVTELGKEEISCPECGNDPTVYIPVKLAENGKEWHIPEYIRGGWAFETRDKNTNAPIRYEANILTQNTVVYADSKKMFHSMTEYSRMIDLMNNDIRVSKKKSLPIKSQDGKIRFEEKGIVRSSVDPYQISSNKDTEYSAKTLDQIKAWNANKDGVVYNTAYNPIEAELFSARVIRNLPKPLFMSVSKGSWYTTANYSTAPLFDQKMLMDWNSINMAAEKQFVAEKFIAEKRIDPLFVDWNKNGLFLNEHHPGSTEENSDINEEIQRKYLMMIIRYPVAFEYACERAEGDLQNEYYMKKRKYDEAMKSNDPEVRESAKPPVPVAEMPDSVKCRYFRQEVRFVAEQLATVDNKVLAAISESKSVEDMKSRLQFFAFGDNNTKKGSLPDAQTPKNIRGVKTNEAGKYENTFDATNQLAQMFRQNPIGVANTAYTCHKIGIKDSALMKEILEYAETQSPPLNSNSNTGKNMNWTSSKYKKTVNAKTITPITDKNTLRFLRTYIKNYSPENLMGQRMVAHDILMNENNAQFFIDSVRMYTQVKDNPNVIIDTGSSENDMQISEEEQTKSRLKLYLAQQPTDPPEQAVKNAYRDYAMDGFSKEDIDNLCRTIKHESAMNKIKKYYTENGADAALNQPQIAEYMLNLEKDGIESDEEKIAAIESYIPTDRRQVYIGTKDRKPLFANRPLHSDKGHWAEHGLHDELSSIISKVVNENETIEYDEREKALEGSYPASPETPEIQYSFHLMKDKYDFIRTATELSNCVAGSSYFENASKEDHDRRTYCFYMTDEKMNKVACIEVAQKQINDPDNPGKVKKAYEVKQFQSYNDRSLPAQYAYAAVEWMNDKSMKSVSSDCETFSKINADGRRVPLENTTNKFFYGENADYHSKEIDEVNNIVVEKTKMSKIRKDRSEYAKKMYPDGIPEPPADLIGSLEFKLDIPDDSDTKSKSGTSCNVAVPEIAQEYDDEYGASVCPF